MIVSNMHDVKMPGSESGAKSLLKKREEGLTEGDENHMSSVEFPSWQKRHMTQRRLSYRGGIVQRGGEGNENIALYDGRVGGE